MLNVISESKEEKPEENKDKLRTTCKGCVFNLKYGCFLGKTIYYDRVDLSQYLEGFCRYKRSEKWLNQLFPKGSHGEAGQQIDKINQENNKLSVVIIHLNNTIEQLEKTIKSLLCHDIIKEVVVISKEETDDGQKEILSRFYDKGWHWQYQNLQKLEDIDNLDDCGQTTWRFMIEFGIKLAKNHWLVLLNSGVEINQNDPSTLLNQLNYIDNSYVGFWDSCGQKQLFFSNDIYKAMKGDEELPWLEKLSQFSNGKEVLCSL